LLPTSEAKNAMSFRDLLKDTLATLWAHKRRTLLTMFGIAWGIISITVMVAAGEGLGVGIQRNQETFGKDVMIVFSGRTSMQAGGSRAGRVVHWMEDDYLQVAKESPACKYVMPEMGNEVQVHSAFNSGTISTVGSLPPFSEIRSVGVAEGRFYNDKDNAEARHVAFLGTETKKQLFAEREAIGATISLNGIPYRVIGVMKSKDQNSSYDGFDTRKIFVPFNAMRRDFPTKPPAVEHTVDRLLVAPWSLETHPDCVRQVRRTLARLHNFDPRDKEAAGMWDTVKNAEANRMIIVGMEIFMGAVGIATLFLGGLGVMNVMLVSVRERTREIGVRMALGATRESILRQFFMETIFVVFLSGGTGLLLAYGFCGLVNLLPMPPFFAGLLASWKLGALSISLLSVIAVLSALYPANRAASVDPIEALRFEAGG
jgi:putative ABC transport system permease protein